MLVKENLSQDLSQKKSEYSYLCFMFYRPIFNFILCLTSFPSINDPLTCAQVLMLLHLTKVRFSQTIPKLTHLSLEAL